MNDLIEKCADIEHKRWSKWHLYMVSKSTLNDDGSLTIPKELVNRWARQATKPYNELTESEKDSDRKEVESYLPILCKYALKHNQIKHEELLKKHGFEPISKEQMQDKIDRMSEC